MNMKFKWPRNWTQWLLFLSPIALVVVRRSATLLLAIAAIITVFKNRKFFQNQIQSAKLDRFLLIGIAVLVIWAIISLAWSPLPARGFKQLAFDFILPISCGLWLLTLPPSQDDKNSTRWFALSVAGAAIIVALQLHFQFRIEALFNSKESHGEAWRFNMVVVTYALFVPALLPMLKRIPYSAGLAILSIVCASILSQSATSKTALIAAIYAYVFVQLLPRKLAMALFSIALLSLIVLQPWQGRFVDQALQATHQTQRLFQSAVERIVIWKATGTLALEAMPWGTGIGSSDAVSDSNLAKLLPPDLQVGLRQTHAHNAFLNVIMELGLPGFISLFLIAVGILRTLSKLPDRLFLPGMMLVVQIITVNLISHGAWQAWWFTGIMLGILAIKEYAPSKR